MASEWNLFVKKIYEEGKKSNSSYQFKDALKEASERKSEMKSMNLGKGASTKKMKRMKKSMKHSRKHRKGGDDVESNPEYEEIIDIDESAENLDDSESVGGKKRSKRGGLPPTL